jgi:uncharacterized protein (DUF1330 family)
MPTNLEVQTDVPAYFVAEVENHDLPGFTPYAEQIESTFIPFGGRILSFGATILFLEGMQPNGARAAIIVFPSLKAGQEWFASAAYRKIAPLREKSARTRAFFVEGLPAAPAS